MDLTRAVYLSALPHRQAFYRRGGWKLSSPHASDWRSFLRDNFTEADRRYALSEARKTADLTRDERACISVLTIWDAEYPACLAGIFDPPPVLFIQGDPLPRSNSAYENSLAIVGTRDPAPIALLAVDACLEHLSRIHASSSQLPLIVSGFARGIDGRAHAGAIENGLPGIAVLGAGFRYMGPRVNRELPERARQYKVPFSMVTEFSPWTKGHARNFPRRNRIIAGLVPRVAIMQAPRGSGALITGRFALDEGRDVVVFDHNLLQGRGFNEGGRDFLEAGAFEVEVPGLDERILREPPDVPGATGPTPEQLDFRVRRGRGEFIWLGGEHYLKKLNVE